MRVLVVADAAADVSALNTALADGGYALIGASSIGEAQALLAKHRDIALVLLDMPLSDEACAKAIDQLRSVSVCGDIPLLIVTAAHRESLSYGEGVVDEIIKPIAPALLLRKVHLLIDLYQTKLQLHEARRQQAALEQQIALAKQVFEHAGEGLLITNKDSVIEAVNHAFEEISGYTAEEAIGQTPQLLSSARHTPEFYRDLWQRLEDTGFWEGEIYNRRKNGEIYPEWLKIIAVKNDAGEVTHYIGSFSDISTHTAAKQRLYHLAHYDEVTELPNRVLFNETLKRELLNAKRRQAILAVFFMDLDHFKHVNDSLGHAAGDQLLREASRRLLRCKRDNDLIARQGGDEFTGLLLDLIQPRDAAIVAERILKAMAEPFLLEGEQLHLSGSIGLSIYPSDGEDPDTLMRKADTAMYHAKGEGRNRYQFYTEAMHRESKQRLELESRLRKAIEQEEFELYYQPQVNASSGEVIGMETLIRWQQADVGTISPAEFIPLAEDTGLIVPIGTWVLRTACKQAKAWLDMGLPPLMLSVNLSSHQFREADFMEVLAAAIEDSGIPPEYLQLELTERIIMHEDEFTISRLKKIHAAGIHLSIDDFGTGYSSMSYLKRFPLNELKIDKSFIDEVCTDEDDAVIVSAMINLAHALNLTVIAEGVESSAQLNWLEWHGCDGIQGYYFSKPLSAKDFELFMIAKIGLDSGEMQ